MSTLWPAYVEYFTLDIPQNVGALNYTISSLNKCGDYVMLFVGPETFPCAYSSSNNCNSRYFSLFTWDNHTESLILTLPSFVPGTRHYIAVQPYSTPVSNCQYELQVTAPFQCKPNTTAVLVSHDNTTQADAMFNNVGMSCFDYSIIQGVTSNGQSFSRYLTYDSYTHLYRVDVPQNVSRVWAIIDSSLTGLYLYNTQGAPALDSYFVYYGTYRNSLDWELPQPGIPIYFAVKGSIVNYGPYTITFGWSYCGAAYAGLGAIGDYNTHTFSFPDCAFPVVANNIDITAPQSLVFDIPATAQRMGSVFGFMRVPAGLTGSVSFTCSPNNYTNYLPMVVFQRNGPAYCYGGTSSLVCAPWGSEIFLSNDLYPGEYWSIAVCSSSLEPVSITLYSTGLLTNTVGSSCPTCSSDNDCFGGHGVCVSSPNGNYCSCLSGFGGCDCSEPPSPTCAASFSEVDTLSANFQANATVDYTYPYLLVTVDAILEESSDKNGTANSYPYSTETLVFFGPSSSSFPACSYPNGGQTWTDYPAQGGMCYDKYVSNMTWSFAKDNCGFAAANGTRNYTQTGTIQRKYNLNGMVQRTEQSTRSLYIVFPNEVSVSQSNVSVSFPNAEIFAALTFVDYNPDTQHWTVEVQVSMPAPYYLVSSPSVISLTGNLAQRTPFVFVTPCNNTGNTCVQTIMYTFPKGTASDACLGLSGQDLHSFPVACSTTNCPNPPALNLSLTLNTGNACPATDYITFDQTSLRSYKDSSLYQPADSFTINDAVYYGAVVETSEAMISSRSIKPNSVCFQPQAGPCYYVSYTTLTPTNGKDPVFLVDLKDTANAGYFQNLTSPTQFSVSATVEVSFVGAKGLLKNVPQKQSIQTIAHALIEPIDSVSSAALISPLVALVFMVMFLL